MNDTTVQVRYLELTRTPAPIGARPGDERISAEKVPLDEYLDLYQRVGAQVRWDQRLKLPRLELKRLLESASSQIYVLRDACGHALGLCEFERGVAEVELKNFGLVPAAQGNGLGAWLLLTALHQEWQLHPQRIWLHTDNWDHPAAVRLYERAGFRTYLVRHELPEGL